VILSRFGSDGKMTKEHEFPGHYGQLAMTRSGVLIIYDAGVTPTQDIRLRRVSQDLSLEWEMPLGTFQRGFQLFAIAPTSDGGALVGGTKSALPWLSLTDSLGKITSSYWEQSQDRA